MKRKVKFFKRTRGDKTYQYPWIGYSFRNHNGTPDFKREISLADLPEHDVQAIAQALAYSGRACGEMKEVQFVDSVNVGAAWTAFRLAEQLGIVQVLEKLQPKHYEAALFMILDRVTNPKPYSKSALYESLPGTGLERVVSGAGMTAQQHDFYAALEVLCDEQRPMQKALFSHRSRAQRIFLYDITSSYLEGTECPLSAFGYNRDGKKGKLQIVIGLLADSAGKPVAVEVFEGNTSDQTTVMGQIDKLRNDFGIEEMIFVGDRGMLTAARRRDLQAEDYAGIQYITALTRQEFFTFLDDQSHPLQLTLFDRQNLVEISHEGVRYVLCFNPAKEREDKQTRLRLLEKTEEKLEMIRRNVEAGNWKREKVIAAKLHRWLNRWGMSRFFTCEYGPGAFSWRRNEEVVTQYEAVDGAYVITSDTTGEQFAAAELQQRYKSLAAVEQAFRTMKSTELFVRPIRHWNAKRVKGHVFVCMLAYMIIWEARRVFRAELTKTAEDDTSERDHPAALAVGLRSVWNQLDQVKIGAIKIGTVVHEQLNPLNRKQKALLKAANATLTVKAREKIGLVG